MDKTAAACHKIQQRRFLICRDIRGISIKHQCVILQQIISIQFGRIVGIDELNTLCSHVGVNLERAFRRLVVTVVPKKEHAQPVSGLAGGGLGNED